MGRGGGRHRLPRTEVTTNVATGATVGLIVGAGAGARFGGDGPKGFALLAGEPLLVHAVRTFLACPVIDRVVLVVGPAALDVATTALDRAGLAVGAVVAGGASRQDSVRRGLDACPEAGVVAVHDAARPLVSVGLVTRTVAALVEPWAAVAPGLPMVDTMKLVQGGEAAVVRTVDRAGLWSVQTPQVFALRTLQEVHAGGAGTVTDDLMLVERAGGSVRLILGERRNFKVTYPEDLVIAEALLTAQPLQ